MISLKRSLVSRRSSHHWLLYFVTFLFGLALVIGAEEIQRITHWNVKIASIVGFLTSSALSFLVKLRHVHELSKTIDTLLESKISEFEAIVDKKIEGVRERDKIRNAIIAVNELKR